MSFFQHENREVANKSANYIVICPLESRTSSPWSMCVTTGSLGRAAADNGCHCFIKATNVSFTCAGSTGLFQQISLVNKVKQGHIYSVFPVPMLHNTYTF